MLNKQLVATPMSDTEAEAQAADVQFQVSAPFDLLSPGDCILQSKEGIQFKVFRQILILASAVMADMFSLPQGKAKAELDQMASDHLPVILLDEDAETINGLLLLLYPTTLPKTLGVHLALKLAQVHDKYLIPPARLRLLVATLYGSRENLKETPLEFYKLAWQLEMLEEAKIASRFTHSISLKDLYTGLSPEHFQSIMDLRRRREECLDDLIGVLEPKKHLCDSHAGSDVEFFEQIKAVKDRVRESIQEPYPEDTSSRAFFGTVNVSRSVTGIERLRFSDPL
ncbi:hypothetical protein FRB90_002605 [Tulasnella sp. 427]|nr:hypothetical protein FRB90_002605 [Tulasnella sp. 427]